MGQAHDRLAGGHHLPGLGQGLDHHAVGVGGQHRIAGVLRETRAWASAACSWALAASAAALAWS
jgi:hypothetical protein